MPKGTRVHKQADAMMKKGVPPEIAIPTAQKRTGQSFATGKKKTKEGKPVGGKRKGKGK
jgi:hypothetical protein